MRTPKGTPLALLALAAPYLAAAVLLLVVLLTALAGWLAVALTGVVVVVAYGVVMRPALRRANRPVSGIGLSRGTQPLLWATVDEVATAVGTRTPDELRLVPNADAVASEESRLLGLRRGTRRLAVGLPLLSGLTQLQLKALIAHELGHYAGRAGLVHRGAEAVRAVSAGLRTRAVFVRYAQWYEDLAHGVIRRQELAADGLSVRIAGRGPARAALREQAAIDRAWQTFLDRYADLGADAGRRPLGLFEGFRQFFAEPTRQLQLVEVRNSFAESRDSDHGDHPSPRDRIAAIDACPDDGVIDECTPALRLLIRPERPMAELEAWMFKGSSLTPTPWDGLASTAAADSARNGAGLLAAAAEEAGVVKRATMNAVFDAIRRGDTAKLVAPLLEADAPEAERDRLAQRLLGHLIVCALLDAGWASYRLNWAGPPQLVGADGTPFDPSRLVAHAIGDRTAAYTLQGWVTACGVLPSYRADSPSRPAGNRVGVRAVEPVD